MKKKSLKTEWGERKYCFPPFSSLLNVLVHKPLPMNMVLLKTVWKEILENKVGKKKILRFPPFSLLLNVLVHKPLPMNLVLLLILLTLSQRSPGFYVSAVQVFRKHWEKEKLLEKLLITSNFPQCFLQFHQIWNCHLQTLSVSKSLKFAIWERVMKILENKVGKKILRFLPFSPLLNILVHKPLPMNLVLLLTVEKEILENKVGKKKILRFPPFSPLLNVLVHKPCQWILSSYKPYLERRKYMYWFPPFSPLLNGMAHKPLLMNLMFL